LPIGYMCFADLDHERAGSGGIVEHCGAFFPPAVDGRRPRRPGRPRPRGSGTGSSGTRSAPAESMRRRRGYACSSRTGPTIRLPRRSHGCLWSWAAMRCIGG
jgi:hypothetical protein